MTPLQSIFPALTAITFMAAAITWADENPVNPDAAPPTDPGPAALPPVPAPARDFAQFEFLMQRSPFSLPTAEEKSPSADRYSITGAASWDGQQRIFVVDKTSQERLVISNEPNRLNMSLLEFLPDGDPRRMRARVKIGSEVATLEFAEMAAASPATTSVPIPGQPGQPGQPVIQQPGGATPQISSTGQPAGQPTRRIIRRRIITGAPPPAQ